jgi:hypothetical protein
MAPVTSIPTTIAASISRKCRQNGDALEKSATGSMVRHSEDG